MFNRIHSPLCISNYFPNTNQWKPLFAQSCWTKTEHDVHQKKSNRNTSNRFVYLKTEEKSKQLVQKRYKEGTNNNTKWAVKCFENWQQDRNKRAKTNSKISPIEGSLISMTKSQLNRVLGYFVTEVRNKKGFDYYPKTHYDLIICIQRFLRQNGRSISIFYEKDFSALRSVLGSRMKELSSNRNGLNTKNAGVISVDQETYMWCNNSLETDTPKKLDSLQHCIGLNVALRARKEQTNLRVGDYSQIYVNISPADGRKYLEYTKDVSKKKCGGIELTKNQPKVVKAYQNTVCPERCIIHMYQQYTGTK